ncbi:MAG: cytochrome C peroxidase [Akkermansiaceae bacterium]|nr:cytochrome C peroxidase [Akkermansiaceae bacterium]MCP5547522.1 cytochrome C peroxidase [Akkermansiaceae bacterium]
MNLEFRARAGDRELAVGDSWDGGENGELSLSRLDFLLSGLALQRDDGTWVEAAADWAEFVGIGKDRRNVRCDGVAAGIYQRVRFRIGLDPRTDLLDPATFAPGHPLHPDVNGLHWSWQGGFIYMALEGRTSRPVKGGDGFSFHLARAGNAPTVELPVSFRGDAPATLRIDIDVPTLLRDIDFARDGNSTHSRDGDPIPRRMARNLTCALCVASVASGPLVTLSEVFPEPAAIPPGTRPFDLRLPRRFPAVGLPADNPLTVEGVELGRRLFHETRISVNDSVSCATCHQQETGFADVRRFSIGAEGHAGRRRSMPLANLAWQKDFFWDGRAASLREQVLMPIADPHEMNETPGNVAAKLGGDPVYQKAFTRAFGSPGVTVERLSLALEQFLLTKVSHQARFDLALEGAAELTETEKRGLQLFVTEHAPERGLRGADCFHCHGGMLFTDNRFHDNGLALDPADPGRMEVTGDEADRGKFKTPSLRNVALRPPFMHDGRFATLEEVVEHYNSGVLRRPNLDPNLAKHPAGGLGLSDLEKKELVAFLRTLTDESFTSSQPDSPQP